MPWCSSRCGSTRVVSWPPCCEAVEGRRCRPCRPARPHPQAARLVEEVLHLRGHVAVAGRRAEDDGVVIGQFVDAGDRRGLVDLEVDLPGDFVGHRSATRLTGPRCRRRARPRRPHWPSFRRGRRSNSTEPVLSPCGGLPSCVSNGTADRAPARCPSMARFTLCKYALRRKDGLASTQGFEGVAWIGTNSGLWSPWRITAA